MANICCASDKPSNTSMSIQEIRDYTFSRGRQGSPTFGGELKRSKTLTPRTMAEVLRAAQESKKDSKEV